MKTRGITLADAVLPPSVKRTKLVPKNIGLFDAVIRQPKSSYRLERLLGPETASLSKKLLKIGGIGIGLAVFGAAVLALTHKIKQDNIREQVSQDEELAEITINGENFGDFSEPMIRGRLSHMLTDTKEYKVEDSKGINTSTTNDKEDLVLARNAHRIAEYLRTRGNCYTGTKHALWTSGVIDDYADMPRGNASNAIEYFTENADKFEEILHNGQRLTPEQLRALPAGYILVYEKEGLAGHIAVTSGNGQGMSDSFDNMRWLEEQGATATCRVFRLKDGWTFNPSTKKLEFSAQK